MLRTQQNDFGGGKLLHACQLVYQGPVVRKVDIALSTGSNL